MTMLNFCAWRPNEYAARKRAEKAEAQLGEIEYEITEAWAFLLDLKEEKYPECEIWATDPRDCNCIHCRIEHIASQLRQ
jgi:hypothetical protein